MPRHIRLEPRLTDTALHNAYRRTGDPVDRSHWHFLWMLASGMTATAVAAVTGYSAYWIGQIARRYNADGPQARLAIQSDVSPHGCRIPERGAAQHGRRMRRESTMIECSMPVEVISMGARLRRMLPAWTGVVLVVVAVLVFVASYFLLPLIAEQCTDACGWDYPTAWQLSLFSLLAWEYLVNALPHFDISLVSDTILLVLFYLPLLAAAIAMGYSVGFLVRPHRTLATWSHRVWLTGSIALILMLLFVLFGAAFFGGGPRIGFLGLLVGYGMLWAGIRILRTAQP